MKILVLNYEYPPVGGGGGKVSQQVAEGLVARGHKVAVLTAAHGDLPREERVHGVWVLRVPALRRFRDRCSVWEMGAYAVAASVAGCRLARSWRPDVVHAHFAVPTGAVAWMVKRCAGVPYVLTAHLGDVPGGVPEQTAHLFRFVKPLTVPIWRRAAGSTAVSSFVAGLAKEAYGVAPRLVLNGVRVSAHPCPAIGPHEGPVRLIWVGRMQAQKNLLFGMRALALVRDADWRLELIGDGPDRSAVEEAVRVAGMTERVTFRGWLKPSEVQVAMAGSDVLFMPSLSEGLSMVSVEALVNGLALICSRIGGFADVAIDGVNAWVCSLDDPTGFAHAVRELCADRARLAAMRLASREHAAAFELERSLDIYEDVLRVAARVGG
jgi:glycosyltransferase involved in cell wall biosynthesis